MAEPASAEALSANPTPPPGVLLRYIEEMLLELAELSASVGEGALAASLAIAAIQAGAAADRRRAG